jgi:MFS family permease
LRNAGAAQKNLFLGIVCAFWFAQYIYVPYQTTYLLAEGATSAVAGAVVGAYGLTQILLRVFVGMYADHAGRHRGVICFGALCVAAASLVRILLPDAGGFLLANLISGAAASAWISYMVFYLHFFPPDDLQRATGGVIAANNLGVFFAFLASSVLYAAAGMRTLCILSFAVGIAAFLCSFLLREETVPGARPRWRDCLEVFRYRRLLFFAFLAMLQQGIQMATCMSFTTRLAQMRGAQGWQVGGTSLVYIVFAVLFSWLSTGSVCGRLGLRRVLPLGALAQLLSCALLPNMKTVAGIYLCQILAAAAMGFLFTGLTAESMKGIPARFNSTAMGIFQAIYAVGMTVLPMLAGQVWQAAGPAAAYYVLAALAGAGFICLSVFYKREAKHELRQTT